MPLPPSFKILVVSVALIAAPALTARTVAAHAVIIDSVPAVDATFPLEQAGAAQEARPAHGKTVLVVP